MKAELAQQRSLLKVAEVDGELARLEHRAKTLPEQQELDRLESEHREAADRLAALDIVLDDLQGEIAKLEAEIESVRQREDRDRGLLDGGAVSAKQITDLQHELETLERRQSSLEDSLIEVMERREGFQGEKSSGAALADELDAKVADARQSRDNALKVLDESRHENGERRGELVAGLDADLVALYERQRGKGGAGAGVLQGGRCGACRIEIDRGELQRFAAAADDEVLRCPECGAILLRSKDAGR
jgi:predicted  nucleic acid-binding Zn-ribbon protein